MSHTFIDETTFSIPVKRIFDTQTTTYFQNSEALKRLKFFITKYVNLVQSQDFQDTPQSNFDQTLLDTIAILNRLSDYIDQIPPFKGPRRYGNLACRKWHDKLNLVIKDEILTLLQKNNIHITNDNDSLILELTYYIENCFGSKTRLDYGTGHELSFIAFVAALDMLNLLPTISGQSLLYLFHHYYKLVKKLILTYTLEPAGSHGVWGLDDHFHFIYILGASQWINNNYDIHPTDMLNKNILNRYQAINFYCMALSFIFQVKSGPFSEHSPILYDISKSVKFWSKVKSGLMKMYEQEVLNKYPVVQHFWFGTGFYPWIDNRSGKPLPVYEITEDSSQNNQKLNNGIDNDISIGIPMATSFSNQEPFTGMHTPTTMMRNDFKQGRFTKPLHNTTTKMAPPSSRIINNYSDQSRLHRFTDNRTQR
ncbi:Serine/threonine-protein phosphatase 2A activator 1 [Maudiozyma exigua]|uniref:Serine/threonine-protein phosphatase 2A activator n=1 Tax=Maudiozyma exigua TaxID=34358 RepID=A0A9P6WEA3_MAUEX|nr:Serine/threonine-protein phosphatase 2A activator 1 [Kazachstania exigua]